MEFSFPTKYPVRCLHGCKESTLHLKVHPFKPGWEIRKCPECGKLSAYDETVVIDDDAIKEGFARAKKN
jgi:hypothetical protein